MPGRTRNLHQDLLNDAREDAAERARKKAEKWKEWDRLNPPGWVAYEVAVAKAAARYLTAHGTLPPGLPRQYHASARLWAGVPDP